MQLPCEFSPFIEIKVFFCLVVGGVTPPYTLSGPTTKNNTFFMCVFPYLRRSTKLLKITYVHPMPNNVHIIYYDIHILKLYEGVKKNGISTSSI